MDCSLFLLLTCLSGLNCINSISQHLAKNSSDNCPLFHAPFLIDMQIGVCKKCYTRWRILFVSLVIFSLARYCNVALRWILSKRFFMININEKQWQLTCNNTRWEDYSFAFHLFPQLLLGWRKIFMSSLYTQKSWQIRRHTSRDTKYVEWKSPPVVKSFRWSYSGIYNVVNLKISTTWKFLA